MNALIRLALAGITGLAATAGHAEDCRPAARAGLRPPVSADCRPQPRLEPYDPDRQRAGRDPGFIDLGAGTEVRLGGRVQMDYDVRR